MTIDMGAWPLDVLWSWTSDDTASIAAELGVSVGPEVYDSIDPRMTRAPSDAVEAHEQAVYWLALAARRADFNQEKSAQDHLVEAKRKVEARKSMLSTNWLCTTTGYTCAGEGAGDILGFAIDEVRKSGLNATDRNKIVGYLGTNKFRVDLRRALPWAAAGSAVALGIFVMRSRRR